MYGYPYVWVTGKGAVYELDADDRAFLEERFLPCDSGRPAVKASFKSKYGWGSISGYCARKQVPEDVVIAPGSVPPAERKSAFEEHGIEFVENADRTGGIIRPKIFSRYWWVAWRRKLPRYLWVLFRIFVVVHILRWAWERSRQ